MESSIEASQIGDSSKPKPRLAPKPRLTPKPFSLQNKTTFRSITAPKTNATTAASIKPTTHQTGKSEPPGVPKTTPTPPAPKAPPQRTASESKPRPGSELTKDEPEAAKENQTSPRVEDVPDAREVPAKSKTPPPSDAPKTSQPEPTQKETVIQSNRETSTDSFSGLNKDPSKTGDENQVSGIKTDEESGSSDSTYRWGGTRKRLSTKLTSRFESGGVPLPPKSPITPSPSTTKEDATKPVPPKPTQRTPEPPREENEENGLNDEESGGGSIKRRISLLFDSSSKPEVNAKREEPEVTDQMNNTGGVKERIKNWAVEANNEPHKMEKKPQVAPRPCSKGFEPLTAPTEEKPPKSSPIELPAAKALSSQAPDPPSKAEKPREESKDAPPTEVLESAFKTSGREENNEPPAQTEEGSNDSDRLLRRDNIKRRSVHFGVVERDDGGPPEILGSASESSAEEEEASEDEAEEDVKATVPVYRRVETYQDRHDDKQEEERLKHLEFERKRKAEENEKARLELEEEQKREEEEEEQRKKERKMEEERERERLKEEEMERRRKEEQERKRLEEERERDRKEEMERERQMELMWQRQKEEARERAKQKEERLRQDQEEREKERVSEERERKRPREEERMTHVHEDHRCKLREEEIHKEKQREDEWEKKWVSTIERTQTEEEKKKEQASEALWQRQKEEERERAKQKEERLRQDQEERERERVTEEERLIHLNEDRRCRVREEEIHKEKQREVEWEKEWVEKTESMKEEDEEKKRREQELEKEMERRRKEEQERKRLEEEERERKRKEEVERERQMELMWQRQKEEERERARQKEERLRQEAEEKEREAQRRLQEEKMMREREEEEKRVREREEEKRVREREEEEKRVREREQEEKRQMEEERVKELERKMQEDLERKKAKDLEEQLKLEEEREEECRLRNMKKELNAQKERETSVDEANLISFESEDQTIDSPAAPTSEPTASKVLIDVDFDDFSVKKSLIEFDFDDFSVKPMRWGSKGKTETSPFQGWTDDPVSKEEDLLVPQKMETLVPVDISHQEVKVAEEIPESSEFTSEPILLLEKPLEKTLEEGDLISMEVEEEVPAEEERKMEKQEEEMPNTQEDEAEGDNTHQAPVNSYGSGISEDRDTDVLIDREQQYGASEQTSETDSVKPVPEQPPEDPSEDADYTDSHKEAELVPFPESTAPLLDTSAQRSKANLGRTRSRSRPSRSLRIITPQAEKKDWRVCDSTEAKEIVSKEKELDSDEDQPKAKMACSHPTAQRVSVFPGLNPAALIAQIKKRTGGEKQEEVPAEEKIREEKESPNDEVVSPSQQLRTPRSPSHLAGAALVLPPLSGPGGGAASSPAWLKELKSKKRLSQYENEG